jgi:hypothetical protein
MHKSMIARLISTSLVLLGFANIAVAQQTQKPLTNEDVIAMVRKKLPESVIVSAIQAGPSKFNTSRNCLNRLLSPPSRPARASSTPPAPN